jgi:hypothetical protein
MRATVEVVTFLGWSTVFVDIVFSDFKWLVEIVAYCLQERLSAGLDETRGEPFC